MSHFYIKLNHPTLGANGTYEGVNDHNLLEGIINIYCGGDPEALASMTQEELVELVKNATVNASGSDDLLQELHLSVEEKVESFDTGASANPYPSIMGNHTGTIKPNHTVIATKMYTYSCTGTGGHIEYAHIWNSTWNATATWEGYAGDWHNITFDRTVVLLANENYSYTIRTGSYPQIHHTPALPTANGWINCTNTVKLK